MNPAITIPTEATILSVGCLGRERVALNQQILKGTYDTPLGKLSFTPDGEVIQEKFYVAQLGWNPTEKPENLCS